MSAATTRRRERFDVRRLLARRSIVRQLDELLTGRSKYPDPAERYGSQPSREQVDASAGGAS
jgi:hypothetical protein